MKGDHPAPAAVKESIFGTLGRRGRRGRWVDSWRAAFEADKGRVERRFKDAVAIRLGNDIQQTARRSLKWVQRAKVGVWSFPTFMAMRGQAMTWCGGMLLLMGDSGPECPEGRCSSPGVFIRPTRRPMEDGAAQVVDREQEVWLDWHRWEPSSRVAVGPDGRDRAGTRGRACGSAIAGGVRLRVNRWMPSRGTGFGRSGWTILQGVDP